MVLSIKNLVVIGAELNKKQIEKILKFNWNKDVKKLKHPASAAVPAIQSLKKNIQYPIELHQNEMMIWWKTIESWLNVQIEIPVFSHKKYKINCEDDFNSICTMFIAKLNGLDLASIFNLKKANGGNFVTMFSTHSTSSKGRENDIFISQRIADNTILITNEKHKIDKKIKNVEQVVINKDFTTSQLEELLIEKNLCSPKKEVDNK